ncbi:Sterol 3-beta-glucosyltransferase [Mortierella sp. AD094]|nr:Sterol 3-beta-glucosyltransferase [Mortierella sp. AD094]
MEAIASQLRETFGYSSDENLIGEYSCWLACALSLPGYMYLTNNHVCFYANLPSNHGVVQMEGFFSKKSKRTKAFSTYWFMLKNDVLSSYADQSDIYYPIKTIDLKEAISAEPSHKHELTFYVYMKSNKYKFKTDSGLMRTDWVRAIQKSIFHAKMNENNVKISVPLANILAVDMNRTSVAETIRLTIKDSDESNSEMFFAHFDDTSKTLTELNSQVDQYQASGKTTDSAAPAENIKFFNNTLLGIDDSPLKSLASEIPQGPLATSISGNYPVSSQPPSTISKLNPLKFLHSTDTSSTGTLSASSSPRASSEFGRENEVDDGKGGRREGKGDQRSATFSLRGTASRIVDKAGDLTNISSYTGHVELDDQSQEFFRKEFSLPEGEDLSESFSGHLLRVLPLNGRIYLSDNYICFRSSLYKSNTRVIVPLEDVIHVEKKHGTQFYFHGITIITKTDDEIFFEFSSKDTRAKVLKALLDRTTPEAQERRKEYHAQASKDTPSAVLDDPMESRIMDSLNLRKKLAPGEAAASLAFRSGLKPQKPLHITCLTIGSRGDVQPYIAFCKRLMEDGHTCRIATHGDYKEWIEGHGIEFGLVGGDPSELIELCVDNGMFTVSFIKEGLKKFRGWLDDLLVTAWEACQNTDVLIESPSAMAGIHIAEALEIPYLRAFPFPWTRTRAFPHPFAVPERNLGRGYNYMTFSMIEQVFWKGISRPVNRWRRKTLGLGPSSMEKMEANRVPTLYSWSPSLVPAPIDWHSWVHVTGYWFLDNAEINWTPPEGLEEFIDADPNNKPVYIGFGSMVVSDPEAMTKTIVDAVIKAGVRAIITKGWSDRKSNKPKQKDGPVAVVQNAGEANEKVYIDSIFMLQSVPHDWLFPRMAGAVHHGGAGTTAASLRAGIPTVIKPYFGDQNFWAQRIEDAGVGIWCHDLTVKKLSAALTTITTDEKLIKKAQAMGERIRGEDGVGTAIQYLYHDLALAEENVEHRKQNGEGHHFHHLNIHSKLSGLQHSKTIQVGDTEHERSDSEPLSNRLKPSATEPGLDRDFGEIEDSDETAEELAAELEAMKLRGGEAPQFYSKDKTRVEDSVQSGRDDGHDQSDGEEYNADKSASNRSIYSDSGEEETEVNDSPPDAKKSKVRKAFSSLASTVKGVKSHLNPTNDSHKTIICDRESVVGHQGTQQ